MNRAATGGTGSSRPRRELLRAQVGRPLREFLETESGSAGLLLGATLLALLWANSPWSGTYESLWHTYLSISVGDRSLSMNLEHWVNDGLMVVFFFVIGLELRHEISVGELRKDRRRLILPALGGVGGLVVPALLYLAVNRSGTEATGWGIVIGTDTAFLLGALALVGPRFSTQLRVFLLSMTIADDLLAVSVIGLVYSESINLLALTLAAAALGGLALMGRLGVWQAPPYLLVLLIAWLATVESGVHASITGMVAGLLIVSRVPTRDALTRAVQSFRAFRQSPLASVESMAARELQRAVALNERLQTQLHPWTSYVIVPVFALANAGVDLRGGVLGEALRSPVTWGIVLGLVAGKLLGITLAVLGGQRLRIGRLPRGMSTGDLLGGAALSGQGFSVSLLIAGLAFESQELQEQATIGVLLACVLSVAAGAAVFRVAERFTDQSTRRSNLLDRPVDPARDHIRGRMDAPLTLVEYGDFECPYCGAATTVINDLCDRFGTDLRYVFRHLPLVDLHPSAEQAAVAAEAAGMQGKFWEMHDLLFKHQDALGYDDLIGYAGSLGLDIDAFTEALMQGQAAARVQIDVESADNSGARGTPTFFIGNVRHSGPWDSASLARDLEASRTSHPTAVSGS